MENLNENESIDKDLKEKFKKWNSKTIQEEKMTDSNNNIIHQLFQSKIQYDSIELNKSPLQFP